MIDHRRVRATGRALALLLPALALAACAGGGQTVRADNGTGVTSDDERGARPAADDGAPTDDTTQDGNDMRIRISIGDQDFSAVLDDSAAAADLVAQLPVTVEMTDHGGVEKTGPLPGPLSLAGQRAGADPDVGDLGYYAPGNDLVLYYGDQSYYPGIVVLGRLEDGAAARIEALDGPVIATAEAG